MLLDDLATLVTTATVRTGAVYQGWLPDNAASCCVVLHEVGGMAPEHAMSTGPGVAVCERPRVQVWVQSETYQAARYTADRAYKKLDGLKDTTLNGVRYHWIVATQPPAFLKEDENGRKVIIFNVDIVKDLSTT